MKKVTIKIKYKNDTYVSDLMELDDEDIEMLKDQIKSTVKGDSMGFTLTRNGDFIYLPNRITMRSVFSLIIDNI